jgi:hypothetical protein
MRKDSVQFLTGTALFGKNKYVWAASTNFAVRSVRLTLPPFGASGQVHKLFAGACSSAGDIGIWGPWNAISPGLMATTEMASSGARLHGLDWILLLVVVWSVDFDHSLLVANRSCFEMALAELVTPLRASHFGVVTSRLYAPCNTHSATRSAS